MDGFSLEIQHQRDLRIVDIAYTCDAVFLRKIQLTRAAGYEIECYHIVDFGTERLDADFWLSVDMYVSGTGNRSSAYMVAISDLSDLAHPTRYYSVRFLLERDSQIGKGPFLI